METEKDIPLREGLRKRTSNNLTRSESSGSTIDSSITSSDRADDGKFDGNVGKEKATYGITAMVHRKLKESPLSSDAIFKQYGLLIQTWFWFSSEHLRDWPLLMCRITLPLFPLCVFEKAAMHTHISEWVTRIKLIIENLMKYGLLIQTGFWFSSKNLRDWPLLICRITLPLFPFCAFLVEKAAVHTHISEWALERQVKTLEKELDASISASVHAQTERRHAEAAQCAAEARTQEVTRQLITLAMDMTPFKLDIDELVAEFTEIEATTLAQMKSIWRIIKFSFIHEARPTDKDSTFFMQTLYDHAIKDVEKLNLLVIDANQNGVGVAIATIKMTLTKNMFLFDFVEVDEELVFKTVNATTKQQHTHLQVSSKKLSSNLPIQNHVHTNLGVELRLDELRKLASEYSKAKESVIRETSAMEGVDELLDVAKQNRAKVVKDLERIAEILNEQRQSFYVENRLDETHTNKVSDDFVEELDEFLFEQQPFNVENRLDETHTKKVADDFVQELHELLSED